MKRFLLVLLAVIAVAIAGLMYHVNTNFNRSVDDQYPIPDITVEVDSAKIAHGKYLALGPAHCAHCHSPIESLPDVEMGKEVDMTGGFVFELPIGTLHSPNITSDVETGIGGYSDGQLYRMLRHNVRHDGRICLELMPFFSMSEYDVESIIAFLRSLKPVKQARPDHEYNLLGKVVRTFALKASEPTSEPPAFVERDSTIEYGRYLSEAVANCRGCHTNRDLKTGAFIGEPYAGGMVFEDASTQYWRYVTPNITPDPETGIMSNWSETQFIERMRGGRVHVTSPMPWGPFSRLDDTDLKALYRFLQTVKPIKQDNTPHVTAPAEKS
ncbi:MAG: cytochrome c [Flavobacteriales bacterium]|nr:cytochrome c [Flavobacteriales bacterium]